MLLFTVNAPFYEVISCSDCDVTHAIEPSLGTRHNVCFYTDELVNDLRGVNENLTS